MIRKLFGGAEIAKSGCRQRTGRGHPGVAEDPPVSVWTKGRLPARRRAPRREVLCRRREAVLRIRDRELDRDRQIVTRGEAEVNYLSDGNGCSARIICGFGL